MEDNEYLGDIDLIETLFDNIMEKISEFKKDVEQRHQHMVELSHDMIWTLDNNCRIISANKVAERITGYKLTELRGKSFVPLILQDDLEKVMRSYARALIGMQQCIKIRIVNKNGNIVVLDVNTTPLYRGNKVIGTMGFGEVIKNICEKCGQSINEYK